MELNQAKQIADGLVEQLTPYCDRIQIAGSIRRNKPEVKDIEIVCIPKTIDGVRDPNFISIINNLEKVKGDAINGKYTQRITPEGIKLDLFTARLENWGFILAQRTGSADFSHHVLAKGWVKKGYKSVDTVLTKGDEKVFLYEEKDLFDFLNIDYVSPENRNYTADSSGK